jgi:hypothetical protein
MKISNRTTPPRSFTAGILIGALSALSLSACSGNDCSLGDDGACSPDEAGESPGDSPQVDSLQEALTFTPFPAGPLCGPVQLKSLTLTRLVRVNKSQVDFEACVTLKRPVTSRGIRVTFTNDGAVSSDGIPQFVVIPPIEFPLPILEDPNTLSTQRCSTGRAINQSPKQLITVSASTSCETVRASMTSI